MDSPTAVVPPPAARLSEEAMDLVCSFVREEEDDDVMAKSLCALALVFRRWTSSAVRALWHDPSRPLNAIGSYMNVPNLFFKRTHRTIHVKALRRLPELFQVQADEDEDFFDQVQAENWYLAIVRSCPNLETIALSGFLPFEDFDDCRPLSRIQHLILQPDEDDAEYDRGAFRELCMTIPTAGLQAVQTVTLRNFNCGLPPNFGSFPLCQLPVTTLNLMDCLACELHLSCLFLRQQWPALRHLRIQGHAGTISTLDYLPTRRESFTFEVFGHLPSNPPFQAIMYELPILQLQASLRSFTFECSLLLLDDLRRLVAAFPALEHVDLSESRWVSVEWVAPRYADAFNALSNFLSNLPNLHFLCLGYLPLFHKPCGSWYDNFFRIVDDRGIDLRYKFPVAAAIASTTFAGDGKEDDSGYFERDEAAEEEDDEPDWSWITFQDGRVLFGGLADERTFLEGGGSSSLSSGSSSPSPFFRLLDERVYLAEPPDEPRLGRDFEAEDVEVEEDKEDGDDEPWRKWETEEDVVEADRRWKAFEPFAV